MKNNRYFKEYRNSNMYHGVKRVNIYNFDSISDEYIQLSNTQGP